MTSPDYFSEVIRESPTAVGKGRSEKMVRDGTSIGRLLEQPQGENLQERKEMYLKKMRLLRKWERTGGTLSLEFISFGIEASRMHTLRAPT